MSEGESVSGKAEAVRETDKHMRRHTHLYIERHAHRGREREREGGRELNYLYIFHIR